MHMSTLPEVINQNFKEMATGMIWTITMHIIVITEETMSLQQARKPKAQSVVYIY